MVSNQTDHHQPAAADLPTPDQEPGRVIEGLRSLALEAPVTFRVSGQCMEPLIPAEAEVVVSAQRRYWPGDILAFRSQVGELRVHRLVGYQRLEGRLLLQMRADATGTLDQPVPREQVIGKVIGNPSPFVVPMTSRIAALARFLRLRLVRVLRR